ncbi:MAG: tetratricopeptide repeat protein [Planctomycetes bacterium]|nr:tetratricopeptide repeat protein [Planctomycetota bacterium]
MRRRACLVLPAALLAGCATVRTLPRPLGGLREHAEMMGLVEPPRRGSNCVPFSLDGLVTSFYWLLAPVSLTDLALSAAADALLLPVLGPPALVAWLQDWQRRRPAARPPSRPARRPAPPTPRRAPPPAIPGPPRAAALDEAIRAAPDVAERRRLVALRDRLHGEVGLVLHEEDEFHWLPEGRPLDTPAGARQLASLLEPWESGDRGSTACVMAAHAAERAGDLDRAVRLCEAALDQDPRYAPAWIVRGRARLGQGDLEGADADLRRGQALNGTRINRARAEVGLARAAQARSEG